MHARLIQHKHETRRHAEMVQDCFQRLGVNTAALKPAPDRILSALQSMAIGGFDDELVKIALAGYAAESFEIASYRALIAAAQHVGDEETARVCEQILHDGERMAEWFSGRLSSTVDEVYQQKATACGGW